jgi:hypothetical protein
MEPDQRVYSEGGTRSASILCRNEATASIRETTLSRCNNILHYYLKGVDITTTQSIAEVQPFPTPRAVPHVPQLPRPILGDAQPQQLHHWRCALTVPTACSAFRVIQHGWHSTATHRPSLIRALCYCQCTRDKGPAKC